MPLSWDDALRLELAGETMLLLGERALFWPARQRLVIADLHLGKSHVFRQAGIAVPRGATHDDLRRLDDLIALTDARALWIVGDVLHGPAGQAAWRDAWLHWRQRYAALEVAALTGNHDRALAQAAMRVYQLGHEHVDGPFLFRHLPAPDAGGRHVIAGHLHPQARVPGVPRRWPAFWLRPGMTVLPAFSAFTGGGVVEAAAGEGLVACVEGAALALNGRPGAHRQPGTRG